MGITRGKWGLKNENEYSHVLWRYKLVQNFWRATEQCPTNVFKMIILTEKFHLYGYNSTKCKGLATEYLIHLIQPFFLKRKHISSNISILQQENMLSKLAVVHTTG